ncbi:MAG: hypothetical protein K8R68_12235 [Bacteroidales bacterium]|nr:hypothetical protein [Bacteroidales bacterium]
MKKIIFIIAALIFQFTGQAQYLAAFNDNLHRFWAFEVGIFTQLEHLEIQEYQVGGNLIAYIDGGSNLKIYSHGETETLISGSPIKFTATDYLLGYSIYEQLNVYENGKSKVLSTQCDGYIVQDSLIGWHDRINQTIRIYYNGRIFTIEDGLIYNPIKEFKTGDNTAAYVRNSTQEFLVFYLGEVYVLDQYVEEMVFEAGRDIVAYIDVPDQAFKVFFRGEEYEIESFKPKSFKVGDEIMAYVDNLGKLKLFENGEVVTLSNFEPQFYSITDRVIVFEEQGFFKTYCNGQVYVVERYIPQPYRVDYNSIAYLDQNRFVKAFQQCEPVNISFEKVNEISLIRDLIIYVVGINKTKIYFNGQVYEH